MAEGVRFLRRKQAELHSSRFDFARVDAGAVIGDQQLHMAAVSRRNGNRNGPVRRLAFLHAPSRRFNAVVQRISDQVNEGILQLLQNPPINLDVAAANHQLDFFALVTGQFANEARKHLQQG